MIPTPHNECKDKDLIAETVLMPGDPKRAKYIADKFLTNVIKFNEVRGMLGYTGYYNNKKVSVMASGMGMPSIGIYSYELYNFYDVKNIIRVGSCGSYDASINIYDVVLVEEAFSESNYAKIAFGMRGKTRKPSLYLNNKIKHAANKMNIDLKEIKVHSSDVFYSDFHTHYKELHDKYNLKAVEMESFALFSNARRLSKRAACILTVSDSLVSGEETTAKERENNFNEMIKLALNSI